MAGPEAANNAAITATLVPLLTLGIPTSITAAILLGAFQNYGIQPGPQLFDNIAALVWALIASLYIGNVMLLVLNLPLVGLWVKLLKIPKPPLYAGILIFATVGVYGMRQSAFDLFLLYAIGLLGVVDAPLRLPDRAGGGRHDPRAAGRGADAQRAVHRRGQLERLRRAADVDLPARRRRRGAGAAAPGAPLRPARAAPRAGGRMRRGRALPPSPHPQRRAAMTDLPATRRRLLGLAAGGAALALLPGAARAEAAWPTRAVRLVVPFAPGGSSEIVARAVAAELTKLLGQSVYVDNKPGAAGNVAMQEVARADDGHTLVLGHIGTLVVNPYIFQRLPYDPRADFRHVSLLAKVPSLYVVPAASPATDLKSFLALARARPGALNYGSAGNGSAGHLAFEYLKAASGAFITHVPYRGTGPQLTDLMAGRLDAAAVGAPAVLQFVKAGRLRCIATGSMQRLAALPEVPSVAEQGFPGFEMTQWYGLDAPASLPQAAADRLAAAAAQAMRSPEVLARLSAEAAIPVGGTPAQYAAFVDAERRRWKPVIERARIRPD